MVIVTPDFLWFIGSAIGLLLVIPINLLCGYALVILIEWMDENLLQIIGRRR